ncbi:hypothetical protein L3Y34_017117 [Caenorhabditis briggsae]|uniref:Uncharacterized protein n=1 Tax=Caenorhabditis briggsae TaxID=6238 RepID=A0AAE9ISK8_CAEBR|nr:hypothetical protein L3Y34_017117 [Caenorhabditis briggsae]
MPPIYRIPSHCLLLLLATVILPTVISLQCTVCDYRYQAPYDSSCNTTCEGDACFIVVNKYFNATINAGCFHFWENGTFVDEAICQRGPHDNRCACSTKDYCNSPNVSISSYVFTEQQILPSMQWLPLIQPPGPVVQPIRPPQDISDLNATATELENGVEDDLASELENSSPKRTTNEILKNEENDDVLTVTTTIGLNVRDHSQRTNSENSGHTVENKDQQVMEDTTMKSFTPGQGSVEITKVTQEAKNPINRNLTTSDGDADPNFSKSTVSILAILTSILFQRLLQ